MAVRLAARVHAHVYIYRKQADKQVFRAVSPTRERERTGDDSGERRKIREPSPASAARRVEFNRPRRLRLAETRRYVRTERETARTARPRDSRKRIDRLDRAASRGISRAISRAIVRCPRTEITPPRVYIYIYI